MIRSLGLSEEYKDKELEDGSPLIYLFGLPLLGTGEVDDCLTEDPMALKPVHYDSVFDYLHDSYITPNSTSSSDLCGRDIQGGA